MIVGDRIGQFLPIDKTAVAPSSLNNPENSEKGLSRPEDEALERFVSQNITTSKGIVLEEIESKSLPQLGKEETDRINSLFNKEQIFSFSPLGFTIKFTLSEWFTAIIQHLRPILKEVKWIGSSLRYALGFSWYDRSFDDAVKKNLTEILGNEGAGYVRTNLEIPPPDFDFAIHFINENPNNLQLCLDVVCWFIAKKLKLSKSDKEKALQLLSQKGTRSSNNFHLNDPKLLTAFAFEFAFDKKYRHHDEYSILSFGGVDQIYINRMPHERTTTIESFKLPIFSTTPISGVEGSFQGCVDQVLKIRRENETSLATYPYQYFLRSLGHYIKGGTQADPSLKKRWLKDFSSEIKTITITSPRYRDPIGYISFVIKEYVKSHHYGSPDSLGAFFLQFLFLGRVFYTNHELAELLKTVSPSPSHPLLEAFFSAVKSTVLPIDIALSLLEIFLFKTRSKAQSEDELYTVKSTLTKEGEETVLSIFLGGKDKLYLLIPNELEKAFKNIENHLVLHPQDKNEIYSFFGKLLRALTTKNELEKGQDSTTLIPSILQSNLCICTTILIVWLKKVNEGSYSCLYLYESFFDHPFEDRNALKLLANDVDPTVAAIAIPSTLKEINFAPDILKIYFLKHFSLALRLIRKLANLPAWSAKERLMTFSNATATLRKRTLIPERKSLLHELAFVSLHIFSKDSFRCPPLTISEQKRVVNGIQLLLSEGPIEPARLVLMSLEKEIKEPRSKAYALTLLCLHYLDEVSRNLNKFDETWEFGKKSGLWKSIERRSSFQHMLLTAFQTYRISSSRTAEITLIFLRLKAQKTLSIEVKTGLSKLAFKKRMQNLSPPPSDLDQFLRKPERELIDEGKIKELLKSGKLEEAFTLLCRGIAQKFSVSILQSLYLQIWKKANAECKLEMIMKTEIMTLYTAHERLPFLRTSLFECMERGVSPSLKFVEALIEILKSHELENILSCLIYTLGKQVSSPDLASLVTLNFKKLVKTEKETLELSYAMALCGISCAPFESEIADLLKTHAKTDHLEQIDFLTNYLLKSYKIPAEIYLILATRFFEAKNLQKATFWLVKWIESELFDPSVLDDLIGKYLKSLRSIELETISTSLCKLPANQEHLDYLLKFHLLLNSEYKQSFNTNTLEKAVLELLESHPELIPQVKLDFQDYLKTPTTDMLLFLLRIMIKLGQFPKDFLIPLFKAVADTHHKNLINLGLETLIDLQNKPQFTSLSPEVGESLLILIGTPIAFETKASELFYTNPNQLTFLTDQDSTGSRVLPFLESLLLRKSKEEFEKERFDEFLKTEATIAHHLFTKYNNKIIPFYSSLHIAIGNLELKSGKGIQAFKRGIYLFMVIAAQNSNELLDASICSDIVEPNVFWDDPDKVIQIDVDLIREKLGSRFNQVYDNFVPFLEKLVPVLVSCNNSDFLSHDTNALILTTACLYFTVSTQLLFKLILLINHLKIKRVFLLKVHIIQVYLNELNHKKSNKGLMPSCKDELMSLLEECPLDEEHASIIHKIQEIIQYFQIAPLFNPKILMQFFLQWHMRYIPYATSQTNNELILRACENYRSSLSLLQTNPSNQKAIETCDNLIFNAALRFPQEGNINGMIEIFETYFISISQSGSKAPINQSLITIFFFRVDEVITRMGSQEYLDKDLTDFLTYCLKKSTTIFSLFPRFSNLTLHFVRKLIFTTLRYNICLDPIYLSFLPKKDRIKGQFSDACLISLLMRSDEYIEMIPALEKGAFLSSVKKEVESIDTHASNLVKNWLVERFPILVD